MINLVVNHKGYSTDIYMCVYITIYYARPKVAFKAKLLQYRNAKRGKVTFIVIFIHLLSYFIVKNLKDFNGKTV